MRCAHLLCLQKLFNGAFYLFHSFLMVALSGRVILTHTVLSGSPNNDIDKVSFSYFLSYMTCYKMKRSILKNHKIILIFLFH